MRILLFLFLFFDFSFGICPNGTVSIPPTFGSNWNCLSFNAAKQPFIMAETQCTANGGHLISIPNGFVDLFIADNGNLTFNGETFNSSMRFWIGISEIDGIGWQNVDDGSMTNFFEWGTGQPGSSTADNGCVSMDTMGKWYNDDCFNSYPFVCGVLEVGVTTTPRPTGASQQTKTVAPSSVNTVASPGTTVSYSSFTCPSYIPFTFATSLTSAECSNMLGFLTGHFATEIFAPDIQPASILAYDYSPVPSSVTELIYYINKYSRNSYDATYNNALKSTLNLGVFNYSDGIPINVFVFTNNPLGESDVTSARDLTNQFTLNSHTVTVVLINSTMDQTNYKLIPGLNIVPFSDPVSVIPIIRKNMKCGGGSQVYHPCKTWIAFAPDTSESLSAGDYTFQMQFISNAIEKINHPERILITDTAYTSASWYGPFSTNYIQNKLSKYSQSSSTYSLNKTLSLIYDSYLSLHTLPEPPIAALVFISDTSSPASYEGADYVANLLKFIKVKLTFVLLGSSVDQSKLTNYTTNFITWKNMSNPQPDNWDQVYLDVYNCPK